MTGRLGVQVGVPPSPFENEVASGHEPFGCVLMAGGTDLNRGFDDPLFLFPLMIAGRTGVFVGGHDANTGQ